MIKLKQVIHDALTNSVEATWVDRTTTPEQIVPEVVAPDTVDADGNVVLGTVTPQYIVPAYDTDVPIRCHSYSDRQMDMLRTDLWTDAAKHTTLIDLVEANIKPLPPAPVIPYTELRRAAYPTIGDQLDAIWKGGADFDAMKADVIAVKAKFPKP